MPTMSKFCIIAANNIGHTNQITDSLLLSYPHINTLELCLYSDSVSKMWRISINKLLCEMIVLVSEVYKKSKY